MCVLALAGVGVLAGLAAFGAAAAGNGLLASGSVWEEVGVAGDEGDWHVVFSIYSEDSGKEGRVTVQAEGRTQPPVATWEFDTSVCSGSFGSTAYAVGRQLSHSNPGYFDYEYYGLWVMDGGPDGQDYSWVVPVGSLANAEAACANPTATTPTFLVTGGNVIFKG